MKKKLLCFLALACAAICVGYASQKASAANITLIQLPAMDIENRRWSIESFFDGNVLIIVADKLRSDRLYTFDRYRPVFPEISLIDGMVRGTTGCAGFVGKYSLAGDQLSLDPSALITPGCREIQWEISHGISAALRGDLTMATSNAIIWRDQDGLIMTSNAASFTGNIPEHYDAGLGPILFFDYADDIARRVAAYAPKRVLETAAGTGIVTRRLYDLLPEAEILATDLNEPMLLWAAKKFRPIDGRVALRPADATALPFADNMCDAIVCQFGVMFYPDKEKSYREAHRVLKPGGRYIFNIWDSHKHNPFGRMAHELVSSFFPVDPPQFYQVPFGYSAIDPIKEALLAAGFDDLKISVVKKQHKLTDAAARARGMILGNPVVDQIKARGGVDPDVVVDAAQKALEREFATKPVPLQAIVFEARKAG